MKSWLYNWLWSILHKGDDHVLAWNDDDDWEDLETTRFTCVDWADGINDVLNTNAGQLNTRCNHNL